MFKIEWKNEPIGTEIKEKLKVLQDIYNIKNNTDLVESLVNRDLERFK
jgi:uncharacterized secreted protein with C-terminal beta-propeller domain